MTTSTDFGAAHRKALIQDAATGPYTAPLVAIAEEQRLTERLMARLEQAKQRMGSRYCMHPAYDFEANPHHSRAVKSSATLAPIVERATAAGRI